MASATLALELVTVFPPASWIVTLGWVAHPVLLVPPPGWVKNASLVAAPGLTVKAPDAPVIVPSDTVIVGLSALVSVTDVVVAPPVKLTGFTGYDGWLPSGALPGPDQFRLLPPLYVVAMLSNAS
jgi:hypothetical protein